ncbi:phytochrome family protein [Pseudomonas saliphila]|uniref:hypothetical protein n=1 Tax=Pseudomonas saliphila TaxID=2586906 RepID=UPI00123A9E2D|nr:hypothetical protein [Pseudomonas saliphila]
MAQAIQVTLANGVLAHGTASEQHKQMVRRLRQADNLLAALTASDLNIASLVSCEAAAVTRNGEAASTGGELDYLALQLAENLDDAEDQDQVGIQREADGRAAREEDTYCNVLAVRFSPSERGWLFWFRKQGAASAKQPGWTEADIVTAQRLRIDLLEICLAQATEWRQAHTQAARRLAHDLSTPLQTLDMSSSMLKVEDERNIDLQRHILDAVAQLRQRVEQLRQLGRGKLP